MLLCHYSILSLQVCYLRWTIVINLVIMNFSLLSSFPFPIYKYLNYIILFPCIESGNKYIILHDYVFWASFPIVHNQMRLLKATRGEKFLFSFQKTNKKNLIEERKKCLIKIPDVGRYKVKHRVIKLG